MAFESKTDYVGLTRCTNLKLRANAQNATNQNLQISGSDGAYIANNVFGHIKNPNCEYVITGCGQLSGLALGAVYAGVGGSAPIAFQHLHITTGAGQEPVVTADGVQIEPSASQAWCTFNVDEVGVSPARHALTFGAFTYTETSSCTLQQCEFDAVADITPTTIDGDPIAADAVAGVETVNATFWTNTDTSIPTTVAPASSEGWHQTADWTCVGADSQMFVWTTTYTKYLSANHGTCAVAV